MVDNLNQQTRHRLYTELSLLVLNDYNFQLSQLSNEGKMKYGPIFDTIFDDITPMFALYFNAIESIEDRVFNRWNKKIQENKFIDTNIKERIDYFEDLFDTIKEKFTYDLKHDVKYSESVTKKSTFIILRDLLNMLYRYFIE